MTLEIRVHSPADTAAVAARLAPLLQLGDALMLSGDLAAGKTYFVQALARALGFDGAVTSPTYGIADFYPLPDGRLLHIDAYRLSGLPEFRDLGLDEEFEDAILVAEWGEIIAADFPEHLHLSLSFLAGEDEARSIVVSAIGPRWQQAWSTVADTLREFGP